MYSNKTLIKKTFLLMLLMAVFTPWAANAQETVTVCDGTTTNSYIPIYGSYVDTQGTTSEFIIPASTEGMTDLVGNEISKLTFYITNNPASWGSPVIQIYMGEVEGTTLSSLYGPTNANVTIVAEKTLSNTQTEMVIELDNPYTYEGGNLLIGTYVKTKSSTYKYTSFSGIQAPSGSSRNNSGSGAGTAREFLPKTTFTYESAGGCKKPKSLVPENITENSATLTWTAGGDETSWEVYLTQTDTNDPGDNPSPIYQVTECTKLLEGLSDQTTYYAFVRSTCGGELGNSPWAKTTFTTLQTPISLGATNKVYDDGFEDNCSWVLINGDRPNQWCWGEATNNGGSKAIYISNDNGATNAYTASYQSKSMVYATKTFTFNGIYTFSFDWNCKGSYSDYFRVALVPASVELDAGTAVPHYSYSTSGLPQGWIALDGGSKLNPSDNWSNHTAYEIEIAGDYMMVFGWLNNSTYGATNPPVGIDNVSITYITCPRPTNLASSNVEARNAILTWTENGTSDNWTLQYATDAAFSTNLVEISDGFVASGNNVGYGLTGLSGETTYYARVKSDCDSDWSDVISFTTIATCPKPTLSYVTNSATAYTGSVQWTGSSASDFEIAYRPTSDFDPSDYTLEDVTRIQLQNVSEYNYTMEELTPETKYYIYVQADCGDYDGKSAWSNRVIFTTSATCVAPSSLTKDATTSSTVTLHWTKGAEEQDAWQFRYKKTTDTEYTYLLVENHPDAQYTLGELDPATSYHVNVRAWCSDTDQSKWCFANQTYDLTITTECGDLTLPYFNDFEGLLNTSSPYSSSYPMPNCWTRAGNQPNYPYVFTATTSQPYNHGSSSTSGHCLRFYRNSSSYDAIAVLPSVDGQYQMEDVQLRFWARLENYNSGKDLVIGVMEDPTDRNTFESVATVTVNNPDNSSLQSYKEYTITFENYQGNGRYIAIRQNTSMYAIYIDDITVELIPSCRIPKALDASEITDNQATLTWTAGKDETAWNLQYKKASENDWSELIAVSTSPTYTLAGLKRDSIYEVRVQASCSAEDQSDWTESISFQTDCGIWPIATEPIFEDFESIDASDFPPLCWDKFSHEMSGYSYWYLNSNNGLGSSAAYSSYNAGYAFLVLPKMHINGSAKFSFDYLIGSGTYNESCSVVVSTSEMTYNDFTQTIWAADANNLPTGKANATVSLSDFDNQDIYIAFKFKGSGTSGCTWYVDNVKVYVGEVFTKDITAYSGDGGYYLIASPVGEANPQNVTNMLSNNYDLYAFDQAEELEWRNYEAGSFSLESGKGYLYANSQDVTLTFEGTPYNGNGEIELDYNPDVALAGWNLVGNPFASSATVNKPYYRLNETGSALKTETENTAVAAMEGVFVKANEAGQHAIFTAQTRGSEQAAIARTNIVVSNYIGNVLDNAIIRFDNGETLGKFQLKESSTKVYFSQEGKDYAIINAGNVGELPVNFKAAKNGSYTLSVNNEDVEFNYLHLVDNMTGADVNLLECPSYSFEAKTTDYASRFKLVFATGSSVDGDSFAFVNGMGNLSIYGIEGTATLQVMDLTGRILSSETFSGSYEKNLNVAPGVYMLRLIQGNDVKVQKMVIR